MSGGLRLHQVAVAALLAVTVASAHAASAPTPFPAVNVDGVIHSAVVIGNTLFVGGEFSEISSPGGPPLPRRNVAAISLEDRTVSNWQSNVEFSDGVSPAAVYSLSVAASGAVLFVGGAFDTIRGVSRSHLAAVSVGDGIPVAAWNQAPAPDAPVHAMARSQDGSVLYIGGEFGLVGSTARGRIASLTQANGTLLPWTPEIVGDGVSDAVVRALALDAARGRLYVGGVFDLVGDVVCPRLAAISLSSARANAAFCDWHVLAGAAVHALVAVTDRLYVGGEFGAVGGSTRNNLAIINLAGGGFALDDWHPDIGGAVRTIAIDAAGSRLYAGGDFPTVVGDAPRSGLAAFRLEPLGGDEDDRLPAWRFDADRPVNALVVAPVGDLLLAGGAFTAVKGEPAAGLAALPIAPPVTTPDPPTGGHRTLPFVTLDCNDRSGAGCNRICYSVNEAEFICNDATPDSINVDILDEVTDLEFYAEDNDGNREAVRGARYAVDDEAPVTGVSLPQLPVDEWYGVATLAPVTMNCIDNHVEFGCATYYTLNGATPTTASTRYTVPVSLATLFPPPSVPVDDVDPLLHLSGTITLRAFSIDNAGNAEPVQDRVYRIDLASPAVTASLPSGTYIAPATVTLACDDGAGSGCAGMYYTTDNSAPSDGRVRDLNGNFIPATARYEGPLTLTAATVLRVYAVDNAGNGSTGIVGIYALSEETRETRSGVGALDHALLLALAGWWLFRIGRR